ncbi:MAG: hypothetical protein H6740_02960 [Alphaproteobacteria bacterium]|nr:hypothetical protein [Alphaproteobacteria bacterium]
MPINRKSGRVVVDIDPTLKLRLHAALVADGLTMKEWVIGQAEAYLEQRTRPRHGDPTMMAAEPDPVAYRLGQRGEEG